MRCTLSESPNASDRLTDDLTHRPANTVLVVDDEKSVRGMIGRWLGTAGFECAQAADGAAAWQFLDAHDVGLVTLDINLPGQAGTELLPQIKRRFPDTEVLMLTGNGATDTAIATLTQGAFGYLLKPIARDELLFHVRKGFERRELLLERRQYMSQLEDRVRRQTAALRHAQEETIHRLMSATRYRDEETGAHIRRTGMFCEAVAIVAGWSLGEVECIRMAAPMHDLGKVGIPDAILRKPGKLTESEYEIMKTHTLIGAKVLANSTSPVLQMAHEIALKHHEWWDGTGYPNGLAGDAIPQAARIVAIVDAYDAMTHDRCYRAACSHADALAELERGRGTQFDPRFLDILLRAVPTIQRISSENPDEEFIQGACVRRETSSSTIDAEGIERANPADGRTSMPPS